MCSATRSSTIRGRCRSAFAIGTAVAGLCGYLIGKLSFRVRGAYFVIVTVSFAEVVRIVAVNWVDLTQGPLAVTNIPPFAFALPAIGRYTLYSKASNYYLVLVVATVAYVTIKRLVGSRIGRAMIALRENEQLAVSVGIDVTRYLVLAAVVSAAMAGAAGSLYAHYIRIVDPDIFVFLYTVTMVIMVITGGKGTLAGPIVGGLIFGFVPVVGRSFASPEVQWILYGGLMILVVFLLPQGITPAVRAIGGGTGSRLGANGNLDVLPDASRRREDGDDARVVRRAHQRDLRRPRRHRRSELHGREGRDRRAHRLERRRQDDGLQRHHRLSAADGGDRPVSGEADQRSEASPGRVPRARADVSAHERVSEQHRARERPDRPASQRPIDVLWDTLLAWPGVAAAERAMTERAWEILNLVGIERRASELAARFRTETSACSAWPSRWPPTLRCCCSMSPYPA